MKAQKKDWQKVIEDRFSASSPEFHKAAKEVAEFWKTHSDAETKEFFVLKANELKLVNWMSAPFADLITCYKNL
jgi:hypothetical protein